MVLPWSLRADAIKLSGKMEGTQFVLSDWSLNLSWLLVHLSLGQVASEHFAIGYGFKFDANLPVCCHATIFTTPRAS